METIGSTKHYYVVIQNERVVAGMEKERVHRLKVATLIFKGTSDDLLFWVLIDTLFLTEVKGFTATEVSLVFAVSFWVALLFKPLGYRLIRRMKVGRSLICSAVMFLASAVLITWGPSLPLVIAGQCLYEVAPDFYDVLDILLKELCSRDAKGMDYVKSSSRASTLYSVITFGSALSIGPLMSVNPYLPMIICIAVRIFSLILVMVIYAGITDVVKSDQSQRVFLKGRFFDRSTSCYLLMAALFGAFCSLSISYLKLLLQDNLDVMFDATMVVTVYSYCIIATRVVKILGNTVTGASNVQGSKYASLALRLAVIGILAATCGLAGAVLTGTPVVAVAMTTVGLLCVYFVFDPMSDVQSFLTIQNLNAEQSLAAIYARGLFRELISAIFSTLMTVVLATGSYLGVMVLLIMVSLAVLFFGLRGRRFYNMRSWDYMKGWSVEAIENCDTLMASAAALMLHYGAVQTYEFDPAILQARVGDVEHIGSRYRFFGYAGRRPYTFEGVYRSFSNGEPSAVFGCRNGEYMWYPVWYVDEEDGVTMGYEGVPLFLNEDFEDIQEQCLFTLRPRRQARKRSKEQGGVAQ